jgi:hypothetical protein
VQRENYLFLIDVSQSMQDARTFGTREISKLDRALAYVETKLAQFVSPTLSFMAHHSGLRQVQRGLKTLRFAVTLIGAPSPYTLNLSSSIDVSRDQQSADRRRQGRLRRHPRMDQFQVRRWKLSTGDSLTSGLPLSSLFDAKQVLSALIAGVAMLEADTGGKKQAKQLVLLTDGESATAWEEDDVARLVTKMNDYGVELTVM